MTFHSPLLRAFTPKQLFRAGEKGVWYDPSDMSTLWQDSARTTAVTAVEQPVGCIDDKSGNGVNATQSTSASRPVLSARYNLLVDTEDFTTANWNYSKQNVTITANQTTAPDGATTADAVSINTASSVRHNFRANPSTADNGSWTFSLAAKQGEVRYITISISNYNVNNWCAATFDLQAGTNTKIGNGTGGSGTTASITSLGNGWYRCTVSGTITTATGGTATIPWIALNDTGTPTYEDYGLQTFAGTNGNKLYLWGADLRVSNDGVGLPAYQRVNTSTDYDTAGFPMYLRFDGTDDSLATGSINFTSTNKMTVWAGVRKLSDASANVILETSNYVSGSGQFSIGSQVGAPAVDIAYTSKGSSTANFITASANGFDAPLTMLVTGQSDISADICLLRVNGSQAGSNTFDQGSGNYSNMSLTISGRSGNFIFNGRVYSILVRGASSTAGEISDTEGWVNSRARAY